MLTILLFSHLCHVPTATIFTVKNPAEENMEGENKGDGEEDDFQTDEEDEMEVDSQVLQKRKKVCRNLKSIFYFYFIFNIAIRLFLTDANAVMSFRSKEAVFRRNSETTTGNRDVRNVEKSQMGSKCKTLNV